MGAQEQLLFHKTFSRVWGIFLRSGDCGFVSLNPRIAPLTFQKPSRHLYFRAEGGLSLDLVEKDRPPLKTRYVYRNVPALFADSANLLIQAHYYI